MRVASSARSWAGTESPRTRSIFSRITPDALFRMWRKASCSPCRSLMKCSVPLGRRSRASMRMISLAAAAMVGNSLESSCMYRNCSPLAGKPVESDMRDLLCACLLGLL